MTSQAPSGAAETGAAAAYSRLVQRVRRRYAQELALLAPGVPDAASMQACLDALLQRSQELGAALRILRQLVLERLVVLDCEHALPLPSVTATMTALAELALEHACAAAEAELQQRHGVLRGADGQPLRLWVIGMGKLGGRELNVSSDIDLIYAYAGDGRSSGRPDGSGQVSAQEYFQRATRIIHALIGELTEHGQVFRIDLALRPDGHSGPMVSSVPALESYLRSQGREWERFAWLKSRVVAPRSAIEDGSLEPLQAVVLPFVFRQYLDYGVFDALRLLHRQVREHASRRSAGRPSRSNDVKLSRGGIREIEFIVQLLQIVRGGQYPELRTRRTLEALQRLSQAGLMESEAAEALAQAYVFLRRVEHRVQYLDDQQTHLIPTEDEDLQWLAQAMGHAQVGDFLAALDCHREAVAEQFDQLLGDTQPCRVCGGQRSHDPEALGPLDSQLQQLVEQVDNPSVRQQLDAWCQSARVQELGPSTRRRLLPLIARTAEWLSQGRASELGVTRFIDWLDGVLRRESYLAQLLERPEVHLRLLRVLELARWPARYLMQHPGVIDELDDPHLLDGRFDAVVLERELHERRAALARGGEDDEENLLDLLRRAQHAEVFRTLLRDVDGRLTVEQVADDLSALADAMLRISLAWCWPLLRRRHRPQPRLGIIAYGKLGGKELGYGGDMDLVFVFDDDDPRAPEIYAALVRKLITWLTLKTGEGDLYEIDTALRPNGSAGLLVTHFEAFAAYQRQRGSNSAATWEHQAMTRARMVPPRSPASHGALPPEGAAAALGRPGGVGVVPPRSTAAPVALPPEGAPARLGSGPAAGGMVPPRFPASHGALALQAAALSPEGAAPRSTAASVALPAEGGEAGADEEAFDLTERFEAVRHAVLTAARDRVALRGEIVRMRERIRQAHPVRTGRFDLKYSPGGMTDVEFATQYLVLAHAAEHPRLEPNLGNIALLGRAEQAGLLPPGVGVAAADAYRRLRQVQHRLRLDEGDEQLPQEHLVAERQAIEALWQAVLGQA